MQVFVHVNTKVNHVALLIPTNDMALIMKDHCELSCSHNIMKDSPKPFVHS